MIFNDWYWRRTIAGLSNTAPLAIMNHLEAEPQPSFLITRPVPQWLHFLFPAFYMEQEVAIRRGGRRWTFCYRRSDGECNMSDFIAVMNLNNTHSWKADIVWDWNFAVKQYCRAAPVGSLKADNYPVLAEQKISIRELFLSHVVIWSKAAYFILRAENLMHRKGRLLDLFYSMSSLTDIVSQINHLT